MSARSLAANRTPIKSRLQPGQFLRVVVEPKGIDLSVALTGRTASRPLRSTSPAPALWSRFPQKRRWVEIIGSRPAPLGPARSPGLTGCGWRCVQPTAEDRQRITAEQLMIEAKPLVAQGSTAQRAIEKLEQALALWRGLGERYFEARTLYFIGRAYSSLSRQEKAIEYLNQALAIYRELKNRQGEVGALNYLGVVNHRLSRYEKAIEYLG